VAIAHNKKRKRALAGMYVKAWVESGYLHISKCNPSEALFHIKETDFVIPSNRRKRKSWLYIQIGTGLKKN